MRNHDMHIWVRFLSGSAEFPFQEPFLMQIPDCLTDILNTFPVDVDASRLISSYEHAESRHAYLGAFLERLGRIPLRRAESFLHIR